ncbi:MAG: acyl-CoA dehydrogenase family protein [Thermodesulfobacteriota bacterium]|nr:acyl-CoA dehydrogenase family protein [Thermodesulfobacteriota bacterium]
MDFDLTQEHLAMQRLARDFAIKEIAPVVDADEKAHRFQREIVKKMGDLGFLGCPIPEEYGGSNVGFLGHAIVTEEIARVSGSLRAPFNMQTMGTSMTILKFGDEQQKKKYIPNLVSANWLGAFAITEPNAGSDVASMKTTATLDGDLFILNGTKTWITYATVADVAVMFAYTDRNLKHRGMSAFIIDMKSPGISTPEIADKFGWHACPTGEVIMEDVRVPKENLLGKVGQGFAIVMADLDCTRLSCAAGAVGVAQACIDACVKYANEREQFGQPVGRFQMNQAIIADMVVGTEAARLLTYRCAVQKDQGRRNTLETSMAKYFATENGVKSADEAIKFFGAYGISGEYPVERYYREAKVYQIVEGAANIQKMIIGMDALGYRKANG